MQKFLKLEEAAEFLNIPAPTLWAKAAKGIIPAYKPARCWLFLAEDLEQWVRGASNQKRVEVRTGRLVNGRM